VSRCPANLGRAFYRWLGGGAIEERGTVGGVVEEAGVGDAKHHERSRHLSLRVGQTDPGTPDAAVSPGDRASVEDLDHRRVDSASESEIGHRLIDD
jgi:hypothetical protein